MHPMDIPGGQNFEGRKFKFRTPKCFRWEVRGGGVTQCNMDPAPLTYKHPHSKAAFPLMHGPLRIPLS